jgi:hypothetical protein
MNSPQKVNAELNRIYRQRLWKERKSKTLKFLKTGINVALIMILLSIISHCFVKFWLV